LKNKECSTAEKSQMSDNMIKGIFILLDHDESGELEPEEILGVLQDRQRFAQNREQKMKEDLWASVMSSFKSAKLFVNNTFGF